MNATPLASALGVLRDTVRTEGAALEPGLRREIGELALELLGALADGLEGEADPRLVLQALGLAERQYRRALRAQLQAVAAAEATGAHTLTTDEYNRLRAGTTAWNRAPEHATGRANHKNTASLLASWLGINEFEAAGRVADAHRVIGRRSLAGTPAGPRYAKLATLFADPDRDPRPVRDAARRIEKFEPENLTGRQIPEGPLPEPVAAGPDGVLLEDHVVRLLSGSDRATAAKRVGELCTAYKAARAESIKPGEYFRRLRTVMGVDIYQFSVAGKNAEVLRSLIAQWDNPNTNAGKAARAGQAEPPRSGDPGDPVPRPASTGADDGAGTPGGQLTEQVDAPWLTSSDPPPEWAVDPAATEHRPGRAEAMSGQPVSPGPSTSAAQSSGPAQAGEASVERRRLHGLVNLLTQRATGTGTSSRIVPTVNVYMHLAQLLELAHGHGLTDVGGVTANGVKLTPTELRRMLCEANILPHVLGGQGQVLDQGRSRRLFTRAQRQSMLARDRGCIRPGCTYPPELCEANHWAKGGWFGGCPTNLADGAMSCPPDHDDYHAGKYRIVEINGLPHVVEAEYVDPSQTPRRNTYWFAADEPALTDPPPPLPIPPPAAPAENLSTPHPSKQDAAGPDTASQPQPPLADTG